MNDKLKGGLDRALLLAGAGLVAATLIVLVTAGGDSEPAGSGGGQSAAMADKVAITNFKYMPAELSVAVGTKLTWTNSDTAPHTATSADGGFDTKTIDKDGSASVTVKKAGTFAYVCNFHSFMKGTVTVK